MAFPSTYQNLQDKVIRRLRLDPTADRATVQDILNVIYAQICVETEALQAAATMVVSAGASTYLLPVQVLRIKEMTSAAAGGTAYGPPLVQASLDEILNLRQSGQSTPTNAGAATRYALIGMNQLELWPTPSNADTLLLYYVYLPTPLSGPGDTPLLQEPYATQILFYGALAELADDMSDPAEGDYRQLYDMWMAKFRVHLNRRHSGVSTQLRVVGKRQLVAARDQDVW
jgi:hypothetical protein